jgi:hypothetical protein
MGDGTLTRILVVLQVTLIAFLCTGFIILAFRNSDISSSIRRSQYQTCVTGNATRLKTGKILTEIIILSVQPKRRGPLLAEVDKNYHKQNACGSAP